MKTNLPVFAFLTAFALFCWAGCSGKTPDTGAPSQPENPGTTEEPDEPDDPSKTTVVTGQLAV